jgi:hypothetical protein
MQEFVVPKSIPNTFAINSSFSSLDGSESLLQG